LLDGDEPQPPPLLLDGDDPQPPALLLDGDDPQPPRLLLDGDDPQPPALLPPEAWEPHAPPFGRSSCPRPDCRLGGKGEFRPPDRPLPFPLFRRTCWIGWICLSGVPGYWSSCIVCLSCGGRWYGPWLRRSWFECPLEPPLPSLLLTPGGVNPAWKGCCGACACSIVSCWFPPC
jgi:hypothetical protein